MIGFGGSYDGGMYGGLPVASLAWLLFVESGNPGMYRLYKDLTDTQEERTPFD